MKSARVLSALWLVLLLFAASGCVSAQEEEPAAKSEEKKPADKMSPSTFAGLKFRSLGPAITSGRVIAFAVNPANRAHYFVASASGGVWKTLNAGTTWTPVFDSQGSYSIGAIAMDPTNPNVVWVGTGENNSQRSVGYGDGVYKTEDGGKSWKKVGLDKSEHIGKILIDPRDTNVVYVAAQGPLWGPGGDRGLYKTTDGGKTWNKILDISENTGVTDIAMDPRDPDVLYAAAWQRRRHVWTLINGGPESALYKTTDGGANWTKLKSGLPSVDLGRIGLAVSPANPDIVYATVEAAEGKGGVFRSTDRGMTWERRNPFDQTAMYYGKIFADPKDPDRIYVMNVRIMVSDDGGRTLRPIGEPSKHVDNHFIWIDPRDTDYYLVGCDGGIYETFDRAATWRFIANLPVTQFYTVHADNSEPFYYVYGGTQDNFTLGGPSRTLYAHGIANRDWFVVTGGDGFRVQTDPTDPNTVYAESQYGGLVRFDRRTGERIGIQPKEGKGEPPLRWNWDAPLLISPHSPTRLYFAANILFRSDDRGNTWRAVSPDLTRQIDRNTLPVMGKVWGVDAIAKSASTSFYGNITALAESPLVEGLLYVGTDDGLIQISENGGQSWRKIEKLPNVPERTYVSRIVASQHDADTAFALFNNHKNADFKPYILKTTDRGRSWTSIAANLPENHPLWAFAEDHVNPQLLFVGTEFGVFFTIDGGKKWTRLRGGLPTIAIRDMVIQRRENDLVLASFGRGFYILDDYTPLRVLQPEMLEQESHLFPVKRALMYIEATPIGSRGRGFQGESFFIAPNPPFGATFTFYLKDSLKSLKDLRKEKEKEAEKKGEPPPYPTPEELRAEEAEAPPAVFLIVRDADGNVIRRISGPTRAGLHRVSWDLRFPPPQLAPPSEDDDDDGFRRTPSGPLVMPGRYQVSLAHRVRGEWKDLAGPVAFDVTVPGAEQMPPAERAELVAFQRQVARLQRAVIAALDVASTAQAKLNAIQRALREAPAADRALFDRADALEARLQEILRSLRGDQVIARRNMPTPPSISERVFGIVGEQRMSTAPPTTTQRTSFTIAAEEFAAALARLRQLVDADLPALEKALEQADAPHTPGRLPVWR